VTISLALYHHPVVLYAKHEEGGMDKQAKSHIYSASILHRPGGGKEITLTSTNLIAITDLDAIQEARVWANPLITDECTVLHVTRDTYQIRSIRFEHINAPRS